jgi:outer membrane protein OmpA-like peptidoglycan-associated protein
MAIDQRNSTAPTWRVIYRLRAGAALAIVASALLVWLHETNALGRFQTLLFFDKGSVELREVSLVQVAVAARQQKESRLAFIVLFGHADRSGTPEDNQALSSDRVKAVGNALLKAGVAQEAIIIASCGDTYADAESNKAWQDRYVELFVVTKEEIEQLQTSRSRCSSETLQ